MAQEENSGKWNREVNGNVEARTEDYLESLLTEAFKGKGFQKISELVQEREIEPLQKYSESLLGQLDKTLRKELDKNEFQNVSLLLKCIQIYFKTDLQEGKSLFVEQGLVKKLVSWFERARDFVILMDVNENAPLMLLLEDFFDSAMVISRCSNEGKKELVNLFLPALGHTVTEGNICCAVQQEALRTLNSILDSVPREERKKFPLSEEMCSLTKDLAKTLLEAGDYDLQVALSEALCRLMSKKWRDDLVHHWFEDSYLAEAFKEIKDREFETDCRKFLNQLNERLGSERRVYSFPCLSAFADMVEVKKPSDEKLEEFWIDFNAGSQSVTFYVDSNEGSLWDSVRLTKEAISSYSMQESNGKKIVKIYMKIPATVNKIEATKIKISFSAEFELLSILKKVLGDEKLMVNVAEEDSVHAGKQARQTETVIPEHTISQASKDPSTSESMGPLSDTLVSQHDQQLTGTVPSLQTDMEDANQASATKSRTPSPMSKAKPSKNPLEEEPVEESTRKKDVTWEKRNRKQSSAKQRAEGRKGVYDFENSDSSSHEKVTEAKQKILGQKISSQNQSRTSETRNKDEEPKNLKRSLSDYRRHLFSESNSENTSPSQSEKSWILDFQRHSLPKSLDYSRKRPRVRSKLKVLPVSSASSGSDYQTEKQEASRRRERKEMLRTKSTSSSKAADLPTMILADETPLELEEHTLPEDMPAKKLHNASGKLSREKPSVEWNDSAILTSTAIKKPKLSSWETTNSFSDTYYEPRKHFDSEGKEEKIQTGQEMVDNVDNAFSPKALYEDFTGPGVITAFENFTGQLKKLFWHRYKKMKASAQNTLRTSERNVSTLLNQIHECRLSKLETFHKMVVEELSSLEKETQVLANMEKDAVDFWNMQLFKLNSFCDLQKQRIQSVDSALGETAKTSTDSIQNAMVCAVQEQPSVDARTPSEEGSGK
ncbi:synaptonemal complex protein 2-like isoform X6 [Pogoniulus pusillus]|uniref:synaptonemal complex protein 2-like isoform X6 n=1 Tax=Pogoniulus pusillus TaxID=488313 RepID=UPI0030B93F8C